MGLPEKSSPPDDSLTQVPTEREPVPPPDWSADSASFQPPPHYVVLETLGNGGMGVLYKAEDTRLHRTVALKVLPTRFSNDAVAKERFLREARTASALDHQNICAIFDIGESEEGRLFLSMPYYQGETLRTRLGRVGPLPVDETLDIAKQVARGLAKAHRLGIVHRDIKPENLMITTDGVVKILDFGIAKLSGASDLTGTEHRIGTPSYMAPEQSRKGPVDSRVDLWALGVVLYEMLTGRRPFRGANPVAVLQAIQYSVPEPISEVRPGIPARLEKVVARLLLKNPKARYPDAESVLEELDGETAAAGRRSRRVWLAAGLAAAAGLGLFANALVEPGDGHPDEAGLVQSTIELTKQGGDELYPSLSPEGDRFVYARWDGSDYDLFLQKVGDAGSVNLTADSPGDDTHPAFSPNGQRIAFRSERPDGGGIFVMDLAGAAGGQVSRLTDFGYHPAWSPDGRELLVSTAAVKDPNFREGESRIWRVEVDTREKRRLFDRDGVQPSWSPNGKRIAYWSVLAKNGRRAVWTAEADGTRPVLVSAVRSLDWNPVWSSDGYLYFVSDRSSFMSPWRIAMDEETGQALGEAQPITVPSRWTGYLSLSGDGKRLLYSTSETGTRIERLELDLDRLAVAGGPRVVPGGPKTISQVRVSPDGRALVLADQSLSDQEDLFLARTEGSGNLVQITRDAHRDRSPSWLPGGSLIFSSNRSGRYELWTVRPDGGKLLRKAVSYEGPLLHPVASPDGSRIACAVGLTGAGLIDASGNLEILPLVDGSPFSVSSWSPDGLQVAGIRGGTSGIFLYSLATRSYEKLSDTGWRPIWTPDGTKILFLDDGWKVAALDLATREKHELLSPPASSYYVDMDLDPAHGVLYLARQQIEGDIVMSILE